MLGEGTNCPQYPHIPVGADLVSARDNNANVMSGNPGRHEVGPYEVVMIGVRAIKQKQPG